MMKRPRLVQVVVQPVFVVDDGDTLEPLTVEPITVSASDWPTFAADTWPLLIEQLTAQVNPPELERNYRL